MKKKQLPIIIFVVIIALILLYLFNIAQKNVVNVLDLPTWGGYQVTRPSPGTLQLKADPPMSEYTVVNEESPISVNKGGFEIYLDMTAASQKDSSYRSPNIVLREAQGTAAFPLELQIGFDRTKHLQVAFFDLNEEDPYKRRVYLVSDQNSQIATSNKIKVVFVANGTNQTLSFYDGENNTPLAEDIQLPKPFFSKSSDLKVGLYAQGADYDGVIMTIYQFKLIPDSKKLHL